MVEGLRYSGPEPPRKSFSVLLFNCVRLFLSPKNTIPFIKTMQALYQHAHTKVAVNGVFSTPFQITRGVRQGDPLSCLAFDIAIEPLACKFRNEQSLKGLVLPGLEEKLIAKFFADDTALYLSHEDKFDDVQKLLTKWCEVSGAKFNIEKTEIIPLGSEQHRHMISRLRKINERDTVTLDERVHIAADGEAVRSLGAWIGNKTNDTDPWEPILDNVSKALNRWKKTHPTMAGRKIIVQTIIGGHTQFLTKAQGMPATIEKALIKMTRDFMWEEDSSPQIALDALQHPIEEGGLNLLNLEARNEAIELMWLKAYLNFSPTRPTWAKVTDLVIATAAPTNTMHQTRKNSFLQAWKMATRGKKAAFLSNDIMRMMKAAKKYHVNLAAIRLTPALRTQLPAWYHVASKPRPMTNRPSKCLLQRHTVNIVADLMRMSARLRTESRNSPHTLTSTCNCRDCTQDRQSGCRDPHACATEALHRLHSIYPKLDPLLLGDPHDNLSLTRHRKARNEIAQHRNEAILFDPSITCKNDLAECFRIFTNPERLTNRPAQRYYTPGITLRALEVTTFTDGACFNNGRLNAQSGCGVWFGPNHDKNIAMRIPGEHQSNQIGEIVAVLRAASAVPKFIPLRIMSDSMYVINGLTKHLSNWEDAGWIGIKNAPFFKKTAHILKQRIAVTTFQWIKGHSGSQGNEGSDQLAKEGANKPHPDYMNLEVPIEFDLQGAKLSTLTQALAYRGIMERKTHRRRPTTEMNLQRTREALANYHSDLETDETIWRGTRNTTLHLRTRQFLYKAIHGTQKIGRYWDHIPEHEERRDCQRCGSEETMEHILINCQERPVSIIWDLANRLWPHTPELWPTPSIGIALGCGSIHLPQPANQNTTQDEHRTLSHSARHGATRLLQILIAESMHLIWVLRCERVIQERPHTDDEIRTRWFCAINTRLTEDKITATRIKREQTYTKQVISTWEPILSLNADLPNYEPSNWLTNSEVLVGRRMLRPLPEGGRGP